MRGKPEGNGPIGRPNHKWEDNVNRDVREDSMNWTDLAQDNDQLRALVKTVMNSLVSQNVAKLLSG
jgi:hypothetical protein